MPDGFSKLNIGSPKDLDFVLSNVTNHAHNVGAQKLAERRQQSASSTQVLNGALDSWILHARARLQPNLQINGIEYADFVKQKQDVEPFDEALSMRVQTLTETTEKLTEEAIINRKTVPSQRSEAVRRREALWAQVELARLAEKRETAAVEETTASRSHTLPAVPRADEQRRNLDTALSEVASLQIQSASASNSSALVKRLRTS